MTRSGRLSSWLRDPLVHFLVIGGALFAAYGLLHPDSEGDGSYRITVTREDLITFVQYRANAFSSDLFDRSFDQLTAAERDALVEAYAQEEALYREALAMGLDEGDYIIRQRLIQRLEFLLENSVEAEDASWAELTDFYALVSSDYQEPPVYTFTHVFFSAEIRGDAQARETAERMLAQLNERRLPFSGAIGLGDRPLYFNNYIERTRDFVEDHFGTGLVAELDQLEPSTITWHGPARSPYGWHLILLTERRPARLPDLAELEDQVREDWARMQVEQTRRASIHRIVDEYEVRLVGLDRETTGAEPGQ